MEELAKYHHQRISSPTKTALLQGIANLQLRSFPGLIYELISKHFPPSTVKDKGHTIIRRQRVQLTRSWRQDILDARQAVNHMNPPQQLCTAIDDSMHCFAVLGDMTNRKIYTDLCGRFPVQSFRGMQYIFVACIKSNSILMRPMKS